jgi:hypothetical protein
VFINTKSISFTGGAVSPIYEMFQGQIIRSHREWKTVNFARHAICELMQITFINTHSDEFSRQCHVQVIYCSEVNYNC